MSEFRKWTLAKHPVGVPERDCFALKPCTQGDIQDGEVLIKVDYFSLDPGMRGRLSGDSYAAGLKIGDTIESAGIGTILEAKSDKFAPGDVVSGALGWCEATVHRDRGLKKIEPSLLSEHVSATAFIGVLGVPGLTAWFGLNNLGRPSEGETLLISSAAGPVGATCGQLGKHLGLKVVGIAGGPEKCAYLRTLGFDDAIDYKAQTPLETAIAAACADGVNIFFDNVGAETLDAALVNMAAGGRIVVSGQVAEYNRQNPVGIREVTRFITHRLRMEGLVVYDYAPKFTDAIGRMAALINAGKLAYTEDIIAGIENAPDAYAGLFGGENLGRRLIRT